jgi:hypothetical protein
MSASKTNSLLVNNSAPMARSIRGTATELYQRAKTEKLTFQRLAVIFAKIPPQINGHMAV